MTEAKRYAEVFHAAAAGLWSPEPGPGMRHVPEADEQARVTSQALHAIGDVFDQIDRGAPAPERQQLPARRLHDVRRVQLDRTTLYIGIGVDPLTGRPLEVFITGGQEGTDLQTLVQHVAIVISVALQHGVPPAALGRTLAPGEPFCGWPALLIPAVLGAIAEMSPGGDGPSPSRAESRPVSEEDRTP